MFEHCFYTNSFLPHYIYIYRVGSKNDFLASSPIKRALRMCYSEPLYKEGKKQLNSTTNVSISEEISSGLREILRCTIYIQQKHNPIKNLIKKRATRSYKCEG